MSFSTKNNQQRIPSQYVDLSCYAEVCYLNNGYFGLWLTYVSILLESLELRVFFHRDYDDLGSFPMKWTCVKITGCNDMGPLFRKSFNTTFSFTFLCSWFLMSILWKLVMIFNEIAYG